MLDLTEDQLAAALLELNGWYRQEALKTLRLDHRAWMEALGRDELRLLWYAGQPDASILKISEALGWSETEVHVRILKLRRKLGRAQKRLTRKEWEALTRSVATLGGTITPRESEPIPA